MSEWTTVRSKKHRSEVSNEIAQKLKGKDNVRMIIHYTEGDYGDQYSIRSEKGVYYLLRTIHRYDKTLRERFPLSFIRVEQEIQAVGVCPRSYIHLLKQSYIMDKLTFLEEIDRKQIRDASGFQDELKKIFPNMVIGSSSVYHPSDFGI